jgi:UDP-glucose 4-epimerase
MAPIHNTPVLITGGAGFFGSILARRLLDEGHACIVIDLQDMEFRHERLIAVKGDIRDRGALDRLFETHRFKSVFHCAAILAHAVQDKTFLWESNVDGTRNIAEAAVKYGANSIVFISSNCLWAANMGRPVREEDTPAPVEIYGQSKWEGEKILRSYSGRINTVSIRCPTIVDEGRLGLLAILFEFIDEGRKVWAVGGGRNRYQFIYAQDLASACIAAAEFPGSEIFNIGSDGVTPLRDVYGHVIKKAGSSARVASLPKWPTLLAMRIAHRLGLSPLGPYQYRMIAEDFIFDTSKIKQALQWRPTLSNAEMLWLAYKYFEDNCKSIAARHDVSVHRQAAKMGVIRLLKWVS